MLRCQELIQFNLRAARTRLVLGNVGIVRQRHGAGLPRLASSRNEEKSVCFKRGRGVLHSDFGVSEAGEAAVYFSPTSPFIQPPSNENKIMKACRAPEGEMLNCQWCSLLSASTLWLLTLEYPAIPGVWMHAWFKGTGAALYTVLCYPRTKLRAFVWSVPRQGMEKCN